MTTEAPPRLLGRWKAFRDAETASAALLLAATAVALAWANSPWPDSYDTFWHTELAIRLGDAQVALDLRHWVNDGLMVFFFYLLGLEVKRELVLGVDMVLGGMGSGVCASLNSNGGETITVDEILAAIDNALHGCLADEPQPPVGCP